MALRGKELMGGALDLAAEVRASIEEIDGLHVNDRDGFRGPGLADDLDPLPGVIDVIGLGSWASRRRTGCASTGRWPRIWWTTAVSARRSPTATTGRPPGSCRTLRDLARAAGDLPGAPRVEVPSPAELRMEQAVLPRHASFDPAEAVPVSEATGRVAAQMITPCPPGIPAVLPGERLTEPAPAYLRSGLDAGMHLPDPEDPEPGTVRVLAR